MSAQAVSCGLLVDPRAKRRRVRLLVTMVLIGTVAAIAYHYAMGYYLGYSYPRSTFLFLPSDHFNDWDNTYIWAQAFLHGQSAPFSYFPFGFLTAVVATVLPMRVGFALLILLFLAVLILMVRTWVVDCEEHRATKMQYAFILVVLSYPVLFALDRTNTELLLFVFIAGFFYFLYVRDVPWLAALFLAAAIAFKLYPATLLLLLLAERRFKPFLMSLVLAAGLTVIGLGLLAVVGHHSVEEVWRISQGQKDLYQSMMVLQGGGVQHGHTLWGLLRVPGLLSDSGVAGWRMTLYEVAAALIFLVIAFHVVFRETERWKRVLLAIVAALLLPFVSADYTLIYLYFPLVFFLNSARVSRWDLLYVALFGVLLIPVDYYYIALDADGVSISVVVYPLAMISLVLLAIGDRQRRSKDAAGESPAEA